MGWFITMLLVFDLVLYSIDMLSIQFGIRLLSDKAMRKLNKEREFFYPDGSTINILY